MRRKPSFTFLVERRISDLRRSTQVDTQNLRNNWIGQLDALFKMAMSIATGCTDQEEICDKPRDVSPKERQLWAHVAAHTAEVMGNLARGFDERQFDDDLAELERLVDEIETLQDQTTLQENRTREGKTERKLSEAGTETFADSR